MTRVQNRVAASLIATGLAAMLGGCGLPVEIPTTSESPEPTTVETVAPTETTETAEPVVEPLTIPDCETLVPLALAKSSFAESTVFLGEGVPTEYYPWWQVPAVNSAIAGVTVARSCWWGIPNSDGSFNLLVAEIDPATRATLEDTLTTAGFYPLFLGTVTGRESGRDGDVGYEAETHLFTGNVWILSDNHSVEGSAAIANSALEALRSANATLGL
jgi:hypothetical protein